MTLESLLAQAEGGLHMLIERHNALIEQQHYIQQQIESSLRGLVAARAVVSSYRVALGQPPLEDAIPSELLKSE